MRTRDDDAPEGKPTGPGKTLRPLSTLTPEACGAAIAFLFVTGVIESLSDREGHRPVILISCASLAFVMAAVPGLPVGRKAERAEAAATP